jgi:hypothetical protein
MGEERITIFKKSLSPTTFCAAAALMATFVFSTPGLSLAKTFSIEYDGNSIQYSDSDEEEQQEQESQFQDTRYEKPRPSFSHRRHQRLMRHYRVPHSRRPHIYRGGR